MKDTKTMFKKNHTLMASNICYFGRVLNNKNCCNIKCICHKYSAEISFDPVTSDESVVLSLGG